MTNYDSYTKAELVKKLSNRSKGTKAFYFPVVRTISRFAALMQLFDFTQLTRIPDSLNHGTFWKNAPSIAGNFVKPSTELSNVWDASKIMVTPEVLGKYMDKHGMNVRSPTVNGVGLKLV